MKKKCNLSFSNSMSDIASSRKGNFFGPSLNFRLEGPANVLDTQQNLSK